MHAAIIGAKHYSHIAIVSRRVLICYGWVNQSPHDSIAAHGAPNPRPFGYESYALTNCAMTVWDGLKPTIWRLCHAQTAIPSDNPYQYMIGMISKPVLLNGWIDDDEDDWCFMATVYSSISWWHKNQLVMNTTVTCNHFGSISEWLMVMMMMMIIMMMMIDVLCPFLCTW